MKKLSAIILLGTCILLSGCGQDQYSIERQYYWAKKQANVIFNNPHATPPNELQKSVDTFNQLIREHPKSNLAVDAQFIIANLYIATEEYEKARLQLGKIIKIYSKSKPICAAAVFLQGNAYEAQNLWDPALEQYKKLIEDYPWTVKGIEAPIYIAQHYKVKFQPDNMVEAYKQAIAHYAGLAREYPLSPVALRLNVLIAQCYAELKDWKAVVNTFDNVLAEYKGRVKLDGILLDLAVVYERELKDKVKAKEILEELIRDYPDSRILPLAKSLLNKDSAK